MVYCWKFTHVNHRCFIQPVTPKEDTPVEEDLEEPVEDNDDDNEEQKGPPPSRLLNFADIECYLTEERVFVPNLICWSTEEDDDICQAYTIEEFLNALTEDLTEVEGRTMKMKDPEKSLPFSTTCVGLTEISFYNLGQNC